jgi:hypothetical protein
MVLLLLMAAKGCLAGGGIVCGLVTLFDSVSLTDGKAVFVGLTRREVNK